VAEYTRFWRLVPTLQLPIRWLIAGVLLGSVVPFTLIVILPTNKRLLSPKLDCSQSKGNARSHTGGGCC
jgi:hypothetical protein